jgi:HSP20 family protein
MLQKTPTLPIKARAPFGFFENMLSEVENLWQKPLFRPMVRRFDEDLTWVPTFDVYEKDGNLMVKADLPGLKKEDIRITLEDGALVLQGERKEEKKVEKEDYYLAECNYGSFYRRLPLKFEADFNKITAQFTDGVLEIQIPIPVKELPKPQEIPVH